MFRIPFNEMGMREIRISQKLMMVMLGVFLFIGTWLFIPDVTDAEDGSYAGAPGARAVFGGKNGKELFLGGNYIELGISQWGNFGTEGNKPTNFRGSIQSNQIGLAVDYDGFGAGKNQPIDFYLPGDPEERFTVGYKIGSSSNRITNNALMREYNMPTTIIDESDLSKGLLKAKIVSIWSGRMEVTQVISFGVNDKFYKNEVTLKNLTGQTLNSARYLRSVDADNVYMLTNNYATNNTVTHTFAADGKAVVKAETHQSNDPILRDYGMRSALYFYSNDSAAKASVYNALANKDPYAPLSYDAPLAKGTTQYNDVAITLAWESGGLAPAASKSFIYYTSLVDRDFGRHPITYAVAPAVGLENGTVVAKVDNVAIFSNDKIVEGKTVEFTAVPKEGYRVKEWKHNGNIVNADGETFTENHWTILNLQGPEHVTVEFEKIDVTPPVTEDDAPADWQNSDVTITLDASDNESEVKATHYQINGGATQTGTSVVLTEEGTFAVTYWSEDAAGNVEDAKSVTVRIDKTVPTTGADAPTGWQNKDVSITLNASDNGSGVTATHYQINGGASQTGTSVILTEEGTHTVTYWSEDAAGNVEGAKSVTVRVDKTAPTTEADAPTGWQNKDVTISLNASDNGSGVTSTYYQINGGATQTGTSVVLTEEGTFAVTYWSEDAAGNVEGAKSVTMRVDKTAPTTEADAPTGWQNKDVSITLNASDNGSGVTATHYQINGGAPQTGTSVILTEEGTFAVTYWSEDGAGNVEGAKSVTVQIDKHAPILKVIPNVTSLWPANNKLVDIYIEFEVDGGVSGVGSIALVSITSNENHAESDIQGADYGTADTSFKLRATRSGKGQGRIYTITYRATDLAGNTTEHSITIEVPHDQGNKK
jgi:hypothetical protein